MQLLKREEKRLGVDCMPYTEPLRWVLQEPTWAQKWSHQGNQYIPIVSLRKTLGGNTPRWFFLIGAHDRFLPPQNLKSQEAQGRGWYNLIILNPNLRWESPVSQT